MRDSSRMPSGRVLAGEQRTGDIARAGAKPVSTAALGDAIIAALEQAGALRTDTREEAMGEAREQRTR